MNQIGISFIPGTFPTKTVLYAIREGMPLSETEWNRTKVNDLYYLYKDAIEAGKDIVSPGVWSAGDYMVKNSNFEINEIRVFLSTLYNLAQSGEIEQKWWNIPTQSKRTVLPAMDAGITKNVENVSKIVKWGAVLAIIGVVSYLAMPLIVRRK